MEVVLHLRFNVPIMGDERAELFINGLKTQFPGILWANGSNIVNDYQIHNPRTFIVLKDYINTYKDGEKYDYALLRSEYTLPDRDIIRLFNSTPPPVVDGWEWVDRYGMDWDQTSSFFELNESKSNDYFDQVKIGDEIVIKELNPCYYKVDEESTIRSELQPLESVINEPIKVVGIREPGELELLDINTSCDIHYDTQRCILVYSPLLVGGHDGDGDVEICQKTGKCYWVTKSYVTLYPAVDYDETSRLFDQLNESLLTEKTSSFFDELNESREVYGKALCLCFNPPITAETWPKVAEVLYSMGISWGAYKNVLEYNPFDHDADQIAALQYTQWWREDRKVLTYDTNKCEPLSPQYVHEVPKVHDGWEWVNNYYTDFDQTSGFFDSLNESLLTENYQPRLNLYFDPPLRERDELESILEVLSLVYPDVKWYGGDSLESYNPFMYGYDDDEEGSISFLTIGYFQDHPDSLTYTTDGHQEPERYSYIDGWEWFDKQKVDYDKTSSFFDELNESQKRHEQPLNLCFNPPITAETWPKVADILYSMGVTWGAYKNVLEYNPFEHDTSQIMSLHYVQWYMEDKKVLTYATHDCEQLEEDYVLETPEVQDGWEWVDKNFTDYDKTSDLFNQLSESKINPLVKKILNGLNL